MRRLYYGSVTVEVYEHHTGTRVFHNIAGLTFAESEHEAKGWATETALKKHPRGRLGVVQMYEVPDDWVKVAAHMLGEGGRK